MRWFVFVLFASAAQAQGLPNCAVEPTASARAICLDLESDIRIAQMEMRIETLLGGIQGASPAAQRQFEAALLADQLAWEDETELLCEGVEGRLFQAECWIAEIADREALLDEALAPLAEQAYGLPFTTDGVEVFVPLDGGEPRPFLKLEDLLTRP
ncbi:MAG: hypothetical protein AAGC79_19190 [Pseudomonadota bacterium]